MQAIRSKNTRIEITLRKELWKRGARYRKNCPDLPGHPDIAFKGKKVAVFCDSEFWHGYNWESKKDNVNTNKEYWIPKIEGNMKRDNEVRQQLESLGYLVIRFWGKEIAENVEKCADIVMVALEKR